MPPSNPGNNRRPNRKRGENAVIELVRADLVRRSRSGFGQFVVTLALVLLAILFLAGLVRIGGLFWLRSEISASTGEIAVVSGFDERTTDWLTGTVSFVSSLLVAGSVLQLILALFFPGMKGPKLARSALLVLGATGFFALAPGIVGGVRGVDEKGLPTEMLEVDPATARWFHPDGQPLIYYADHLDGERRFWNRPGHTPFDGSVAMPVNQETHLSWLERKKRQAETQQLEDRVREAKIKENAQKEDNSVNNSRAEVDELNREIKFDKELTDRIGELKEVNRNESVANSKTPAPEIPPFVPAPKPVERSTTVEKPIPADFEFALLPGRALQLNLEGRAVEVWSNGSVELTRPRYNGVMVLGSNARRSFNDIDILQVRASSKHASHLNLRWLDSAQNQQIPAIAYIGIGTGAMSSMTPATIMASNFVPTGSVAPAPVPPAPPTPRPPQRFPLYVGRTLTVNVEGDTVECWSDGPIFIGVERGVGGIRELRANQRIRISGSLHVIAGASTPETTAFFVQAMAPSPTKTANHLAQEAAKVGLTGR